MGRFRRLKQWVVDLVIRAVVRLIVAICARDRGVADERIGLAELVARMELERRRLEKEVRRATMTPLMRLTDEVWDDEDGAPNVSGPPREEAARQADVV